MNIRPYTDDKWNKLAHGILTPDDEWNPTILDYTIDDNDANNNDWYDEISDTSIKHNYTLFDSTGRYNYRHVIHGIDIKIHDLDNRILPNDSLFYDVHEHESYNTGENNYTETKISTQLYETRPNESDYTIFIPNFA